MARIISSASSKPSTFQSPCPSPKLANLYSKSRSGKESFVFKRVPRPFYNLSLRLATEFSGSCRLRMHIDCNQEEGLLIYPCFRGTLLALIQDGLELPLAERKKSCDAQERLYKSFIAKTGSISVFSSPSKDCFESRSVTNPYGLADVKPDNILVNWTSDREGNAIVTDVALCDFDIAFKSEGGEPRQTPFAIGNAMWRSPEGQTGRGVTKASDVFSFGLVVNKLRSS
jgi:hypothetical protein